MIFASMSQFHFLKPEWLWAILPLVGLLFWAAKELSAGNSHDWDGLVDTHLLSHLLVNFSQKSSTGLWIAALTAGWIATVLALAGPSWQRLPVPMYRGSNPVVVVLSLAQSMNGADLVPSRLTRASQKLRDALDQTKGNDAALVIYSDQPFVAAPLTSDSAVIREMLPELSTSLMPVLGNRLDLALLRADNLLRGSGAQRGRVLVIADNAGDDPAASLAAARSLTKDGYVVSVLGVGTSSGAAVQTTDGQMIADNQGHQLTAKLNATALQQIAAAGRGSFAIISPDGSDLAKLLPPTTERTDLTSQSLVADQWMNTGYWFVLIPVALALAAFRRGVLFGLAFAGLAVIGSSPQAQAGAWADLWQTPDQQAQSAFDTGDFKTAATEFQNQNWRAAALYRSGDFAGALAVSGSDMAENAYNRGNAFAKAGQLSEALKCYEAALKAQPKNADAKFNRDLIAKLLEQQKQQKKPQSQQHDQPQSGAGSQQKSQGSDPSAAQKSQQNVSGQQSKAVQQGARQSATKESDGQAGEPDSEDQNKPSSSMAANKGTDAAPDKSLNKAVDAKLKALPAQQGGDQTGYASQLTQAEQQELRAVPDDPTGLLRARIAQHYADMQAGQ